MKKILLISNKPEKWKYFEKHLLNLYKFIVAETMEEADFNDITIIATDSVKTLEKIPLAEKKRTPIVFFGIFGDISTEIRVRELEVSDFFTTAIAPELLVLRLNNVAAKSKIIKTNIENIRWMQTIKREMTTVQEGMAEIIAETIESRDHNTGGHIIRTATFIGMVGDELVQAGLMVREQLNLIVRATPLHDIGKISISDSILLKPGPLTEAERLEMNKHTKKGAELIKKIQKRFESHTYLKYAYDIALNHHERFDGKGYPNGKKGEEIPFCARLMTIVDVYDALVSDRVYRKGLSKEKAFEIIFEGNGTQFDPVVLEAFDKCKDYLI